MTPEQREALVERMADAVLYEAKQSGVYMSGLSAASIARAALAVAEPVVREDEREACAKVADETPEPHNIYRWPDAISDAIRARGAA